MDTPIEITVFLRLLDHKWISDMPESRTKYTYAQECIEIYAL